jgi:hypothetical protein
MQRDASSIKPNADGKLPGFHSNAVRFQMLTNFANMIKTNQIKIRSKRVIAELDTWIYKGTQARIDHQDGCHDDTLTCLAMAIFVMNFSMMKQLESKNRDKAMLKAWRASGSYTASTPTHDIKVNAEITVTPKKQFTMPIYKSDAKPVDKYAGYRWLLK